MRYSFSIHSARQIDNDLRRCRESYGALEAQTTNELIRTAAMLARLDEVRERLGPRRSAAGGITPIALAREAGADLLVLGDNQGKVVTLDPVAPIEDRDSLQRSFAAWRDTGPQDSWWFLEGKLYRVRRQAVRSSRGNTPIGILILGRDIGRTFAEQLRNRCNCDVAITYSDLVLASTLGQPSERQLASQLLGLAAGGPQPHSAFLEKKSFHTLHFPISSLPSAGLLVLKSDEASRILQSNFSWLMVSIAAAAFAIGFTLVLFVSDTFTRPLGSLVQAVRALEKGDFRYPLRVRSGDELAEVTEAFDQMRSSVLKTQQQLLHSERLATIGRMASSISHDLRHPLTAIVANSEFLSEENLRPEQRQNLYAEIRAAVEQMNDLIESLLEFSRGRESPRLVHVSLEDVAERSVRTIGARQEFQNVTIRVSCTGQTEHSVDPMKIERAIGNLLINACEAAASESGAVELHLEGLAGAVEIRVTDNGPGVPEAIRDTLFQPFVSHGKPSGTGLGLAVVQKICRDHGGDAVLESSAAGRTVFKLILPRAGARAVSTISQRA